MGRKIIFIIVIVGLLSVGLFLFLTNRKVSQDIPEDYIALFHGDPGEITYETYIYKDDSNDSTTGFEYINVKVTTALSGDNQKHYEVIERGTIYWQSEIYGVAQKNNAYTYVTRPNDDAQYTIDQFENQFLPKLK